MCKGYTEQEEVIQNKTVELGFEYCYCLKNYAKENLKNPEYLNFDLKLFFFSTERSMTFEGFELRKLGVLLLHNVKV